MFKGLVKFTGTICLIASLVGCGMWTGNNKKSNNDANYKVQNYKQDGLLGITDVNPNNPMNPTYHHYEDDTNLMKAVLAQLPGIQKTNIAINGPSAKVRITPTASLTAAQVEELRSQAQLALQTNMPRYNIQVTMVR
ncbi:hypothetical protein A8709_01295 [Paenibacillus pectinilyticus]|uniref:Sporulation protein n=1 Tax=Paenibacillus pectinilyticus TaxID=512399 RepID=A0A1C1A6C6_9BACL|nr:hypothetical protein [Paenibacillus pectinilyticus]OCT16112.1 hypothetical protein A8709_01295 [Paenibacillus pectinilyticus]